jgi:hypothetical protein
MAYIPTLSPTFFKFKNGMEPRDRGCHEFLRLARTWQRWGSWVGFY